MLGRVGVWFGWALGMVRVFGLVEHWLCVELEKLLWAEIK